MRALTLRHPWAFAIAYLGKDVENREWSDELAHLNRIHAELGQRIAIHGGAAPVRPLRKHWRSLTPKNPWRELCEQVEIWQVLEQMGEGILTPAAAEYLHQARAGGPLRPEHFICTGIVAVATVQRVTRASTSRWAAHGDLHIELSEVIVLHRPVQTGGKQGLWTLDFEIEQAVSRQLTKWSMGQVPPSGGGEATWVR